MSTSDDFSVWANRLGMITVPMFSPDRARKIGGHHAVFLDGHASSFTMSMGNSSELEASADLLRSWAWSSNLGHYVIVDQRQPDRFIVRNTDALITSGVADPISADELAWLVDHLDNGESDEEHDTAVRRALVIFRNVRTEIESCGGDARDVVRAFNCTLAWADLKQQGLLTHDPQTFADVVSLLAQRAIVPYDVRNLPARIGSFPMAEFGAELLETGGSDYRLDVDLLLRHAGGDLFQDAHIQLTKRSVSRRLFHVPSPSPARPAGRLKQDAHFTPSSLARLLAQVALDEHEKLNGTPIALDVLDPACGSGVFLIEMIREMCDSDVPLNLRGFDTSGPACLMAEYGVERTKQDHSFGAVTSSFLETDSLVTESWGSPDIVLMNPPFIPWRTMSAEVKEAVKTSLGDLYSGQSDTAIAFVAKAIDELKPGAVLGTVIPAAFLESEAAKRIREWIALDSTLNVPLIGRFRGYGYFREAVVEPAFIVVSRSPIPVSPQAVIRVAIADEGREDKLIRELRKPDAAVLRGDTGWEISPHSREILSAEKWTPRPARAELSLSVFREFCVPLSSLFDVLLGIRTGNNSAFIITHDEYLRLAEKEQQYFRPTADRIRRGVIIPHEFIFYPYNEDGKCVLESEVALATAVPSFYANHLLPLRQLLDERKSKRDRAWWELSEPRPTWLARRSPKLLSTTFAQRGAFGFDEDGEYAIVQGHAWIWKGGEDARLMMAYLALFNSAEFDSLIDLHCPRTQGGQHEVAFRYVRNIPLPDLRSLPEIASKLSKLGEEIHAGQYTPVHLLGELVAEAYRITPLEFHGTFPPSSHATLEYKFYNLASRWKRETGHMSNIRKKLQHPAYAQILELGRSAVPLIIDDLRRTKSDWFWALTEITKDQPVPESDFGNIPRMTEAWMQWAKKNV